MTKDLVVARYNEDISWINSFVDIGINPVVYNKGEDNIDFPYTKLENIGGDAQTYTYHIVTHYNDLADYTIFLQGYPFDHCEGMYNKILEHKDEEFVYLTHHPLIKESIQCGWEESIRARKPDAPLTKLKDVARNMLGDETPGTVFFSAGQQFIVSKEIIHRRSLDFYNIILQDFKTNFLLPWFMERLWPYVFQVGKRE